MRRVKTTLHLSVPLARLVRRLAVDNGLPDSVMVVDLVLQGLAAGKLFLSEDSGVHGLCTLTPTAQEGRLCVYMPTEVMTSVMSAHAIYPELLGATVSAKIRCLIYAGIHKNNPQVTEPSIEDFQVDQC